MGKVISDARCTNLLVYAAQDDSGRTKTVPWPGDMPTAHAVSVNGTTFVLVANVRVLDTARMA